MSSDRDFFNRIADEAVAKREDGGAAVEAKPEVIQLPLWPEMDRAAPSGILRSALFRVTSKKGPAVWRQQLAAWPNWRVSYTGFPLSQSDLDVWLEVLNLARRDGPTINTTTRGILKSLGRSQGGKDVAWLLMSLERLNTAGIQVQVDGEGRYIGTLLDSAVVPENSTRTVKIELNANLARLFHDGYTRFSASDRRQLRGSLTKWLHGYVSSHAATDYKPSRIGIEKLQKLCGSGENSVPNFKQRVKKSMAQLKNIGTVKSWNVDGNVLNFVRPRQRNKLKSPRV